MATFGQYETAGELARGALAEILIARPPGATGPARFVIKHQRPGALTEDPQAAAARFLEAAHAQQGMADSPFWAPIHETGDVDGAAFYVTNRYELHAGQLIHGWVHLREPALLALVRSIAHGLIDLEKAQGRPHGNLKPTNVLLTRAGRSERMRAALTDPLAASRLREERDVKRDVRAIGELIYGLVTHREYAGDVAWPIEQDASWVGLGRAARTWCDLCNKLLAPIEAGTERMTLAELAETLEQMTRRRKRRRVPMAGAVMVVLLAAVTMGARLALRSGPCNISAAEARQELAALWSAMGRDGYLRDLDAKLGNRPDDTQCLPEVSQLASLLRTVRDANRQIIASLDTLLGQKTLEFFYLDHLGSEATLSEEEACGIHRAYLGLEQIREALASWDPDHRAERGKKEGGQEGEEAGQSLVPLLARLNDLVATKRPAETARQWKEQLRRAQQAFAAPGLDESFRLVLAEVAGLSSDESLDGDLCLYLLRREQAEALETVLRSVDDQAARRIAAARIPEGIPAGAARELLRRWLAADLATVASGLELRAIVGAASTATLTDVRRGLEVATTDPRRWRACEERIKRGEDLLSDLVLAKAAIAAGAGLDEEIPQLAGREVRTLRQLYARWAASQQPRELRTLLDSMDYDAAALRGFLTNSRLRE